MNCENSCGTSDKKQRKWMNKRNVPRDKMFISMRKFHEKQITKLLTANCNYKLTEFFFQFFIVSTVPITSEAYSSGVYNNDSLVDWVSSFQFPQFNSQSSWLLFFLCKLCGRFPTETIKGTNNFSSELGFQASCPECWMLEINPTDNKPMWNRFSV